MSRPSEVSGHWSQFTTFFAWLEPTVLTRTNEEGKQGSRQTRRYAVPHTTMDCIPSENLGQAKTQKEIDSDRYEQHHFMIASDSLESIDRDSQLKKLK